MNFTDKKNEGGKRMSGLFFDENNGPVVTVVTVVFNGEAFIGKTIKSVIDQNYDNLEYIIVDGGSNDMTVEIIRKYENKIAYWVSEKDSGIYDAMNKGIDLATGEWVNFLNAGDVFCNNEVIEKIIFSKKLSADLMYGNAIAIENNGNLVYHRASDELNNLWKKAQFGHESLFVKSSIIKKNKFDISLKVAADYDFILKCYYNGYAFLNSGVDVFKFQPPGFSREHWLRSSLESWKVVKRYNKSLRVNTYYFFGLVGVFLLGFLKRIVPEKIYLMLKEVYHLLKK